MTDTEAEERGVIWAANFLAELMPTLTEDDRADYLEWVLSNWRAQKVAGEMFKDAIKS